jgi:hypothetical protein
MRRARAIGDALAVTRTPAGSIHATLVHEPGYRHVNHARGSDEGQGYDALVEYRTSHFTD